MGWGSSNDQSSQSSRTQNLRFWQRKPSTSETSWSDTAGYNSQQPPHQSAQYTAPSGPYPPYPPFQGPVGGYPQPSQPGPYPPYPYPYGAPPPSGAYPGQLNPPNQWMSSQRPPSAGTSGGYPYDNYHNTGPPPSQHYPPYSYPPPQQPPPPPHSRHQNTSHQRPRTADRREVPERVSNSIQAPYPHQQNLSSTSVGHSSIYGGHGPREADPRRAPQTNWGPPRNSQQHAHNYPYPQNRNQSGSSLHHQSSSHHKHLHQPRSASPYVASQRTPYNSQERFDTPPPDSPEEAPLCELIPILAATMREYPSVDWIAWDRYWDAKLVFLPNQLSELELDQEAFSGPLEVREPITIHAPEGKLNPWSIACNTWGPIEIRPAPGQTILVRDILKGIHRWLDDPFKPEDWARFDRVNQKRWQESHAFRKRYATRTGGIAEDFKSGTRRIDALAKYLRWDGLTMDPDFIDNRKLYLSLKDVSLEDLKEPRVKKPRRVMPV